MLGSAPTDTDGGGSPITASCPIDVCRWGVWCSILRNSSAFLPRSERFFTTKRESGASNVETRSKQAPSSPCTLSTCSWNDCARCFALYGSSWLP